MPFVAVQVMGHAQNIPMPSTDAAGCCQRLHQSLKRFTLRKLEENTARVIFTARHERRVITVIVSCVAGEEKPSAGDTLYLNFSGKRLIWDYVTEQQGA